jgi:hypothetical protein
LDDPTAALAEARAEAEAPHGFAVMRGEATARLGNGFELQAPAPDRAEHVVRKHRHPRARLSWRRALRGRHCYQHSGLARKLIREKGHRLWHFVDSARNKRIPWVKRVVKVLWMRLN